MADRDIELSIVIPFFNESGNVKPLIESVYNALKGCNVQLIAIDDGSTDDTLDELKETLKRFPGMTIIEFTRNFGQSAAFQAGFDHAVNEYVVTMDGDMQNDPSDILPLLERMKEVNADMAVGWRRKRRDNFLRTIPSRIANILISRILKLRIHDTGCSLKIMKKTLLADIRLYGEMHRFIPYMAYAKGARITEMEVNHRPRQMGSTKYGLSRTLKVLLDMVTVKFLNEYSTNPIYAIGGMSLLSFASSFVSFILLLAMKMFWGIDMTGNPLLIVSVFLFLIGLQFLMLGLISEIQVRIYFESVNKEIYKTRQMFKNSDE